MSGSSVFCVTNIGIYIYILLKKIIIIIKKNKKKEKDLYICSVFYVLNGGLQW